MDNGARLIFLSDLPSLDKGTKVRFLACVDGYDISTATLTVRHNYPSSATIPRVYVSIELALETTTKKETDVGAWINVVGTVVDSSQVEAVVQGGSKAGRRRSRSRSRGITVQATLVWSAGNIKLDDYEKAVEFRKQVDGQMQQLSNV
ncbi:hypothetical protein MBLNU457_1565t1 [Dothideomycetes sp. NU457]